MSDIAALLCDLVAIPSVNPNHVGPRSGDGAEAAMAADIARRCEQLGASVEIEEVEPGRPNVYATFAGTADRTLAIDTHLDTVGVEHYDGDPFDGHLANGRVWGRGAVDAKATFAVVLCVLERMAAQGAKPVPNVRLIGTVSEEGGGMIGAKALAARTQRTGERFDQLVVAEPTMCAPVHGHKGGFGLEVTLVGRSAHSSKPHLGINAISAAARVIAAVDAHQRDHEAGPPPGLLGHGTAAAAEISGGLARNIVPDRCELYVGRRVAAGESADELAAEFIELMERAAQPATMRAQLANDFMCDAFYESPDSDLVRVIAELSGQAPATADYGTNALHYAGVANETVVFGPGSIDQAHGETEWVELDQLELAAQVYVQLLSR